MTDPIYIGRSSENDVILDFPEVSSRHAMLQSTTVNTYIIEDFNSANGTFINGKRIRKATINDGDKIQFANYQISLEKLLLTAKNKTILKPASENFEAEFLLLENVYESYLQQKLEVMKKDKKNTIVKGVLAFIPYVGNGLGQISNSLSDKQEKLLMIEEKFKADYCCPKCCQFLGNIPFQNLKKRNSCMYCKVQWIVNT